MGYDIDDATLVSSGHQGKIMEVLRFFFSFYGRIARAPFIAAFIGVVVPWVIFIVAGSPPPRYGFSPAPSQIPPQVFIALAWMPVIAWVQNVVMAKRLHDIGLSGWWGPLIYFGSFAPSILGLPAVGTLLMLGSVVGLALTPGQPYVNAFGTPPEPSSPDTPPAHGAPMTAPEEAASKVIEEGTYKGRKWRRYENGTVQGELLGGTFKEFGNLGEFQKYIE